MSKVKNIEWLAGWLEGEAHFRMMRGHRVTKKGLRFPKIPRPEIQVKCTDRDVVQKGAKIFGSKVTKVNRNVKSWKPHWQTQFITTVHGAKAALFMKHLYPFMGNRRKRIIRSILKEWNVRLRRLQ